jgi:hypothetical protein
MIAVQEHEMHEKNTAKLPFHRTPGERLAIFRAVLLNDGLPPHEKVYNRISHEAVTIMAAGGETTTSVLMMATYFILSGKETILQRLREEIESLMSSGDSRPSVAELERLPWLVRFPTHASTAESLALLT